MTKIIAFYLPQFHRFPENDKWWGEGFTEWTNTRAAKPLYYGHYQPRTPYRKNYYDLSNPQILLEQMKLAKKYGLSGFCFYHYWFNGKKLMEKPVEAVLNCEKAVLPYCLAWANEPWTRKWNGDKGDKEVLIGQSYGGREDWEKHFEYLYPFFCDKNYLTCDGKPVFLIYRAESIKDCEKMLEFWQNKAVEGGLKGIYYIKMRTYFGDSKTSKGFQATADLEPVATFKNYINKNPIRLSSKIFKYIPILRKYALPIIDYVKFNDFMVKQKRPAKRKNYYGCFVGWDNTARRGRNASGIFENSTPGNFYKYLSIQYKKSIELDNEFLFINAWNEWAEGAYLEPDERYGYGYLKAVKRVVKGVD